MFTASTGRLALVILGLLNITACSDSKFAAQSGSQSARAGSGSGSGGGASTDPNNPGNRASTDQKNKESPDGTSGGGADQGGAVGTSDGSDKPAMGTTEGVTKAPNINFGMLVTDLNCTFCHLEVHGTVGSVESVPAFRDDSFGKVFGRWLVNGDYKADAGLKNPPINGGMVISAGGATAHYDNKGKELPTDPLTNKIVFPTLDFASLASTMSGTLQAEVTPSAPRSVSKIYSGNAIMVGTMASPIQINRSVLIKGDLVISGYYSGVGTIYVTGNIYIPADLQAVRLASFPYSDDPTAGKARAKQELGRFDGLGLATPKNIFVGDIENYMDSGQGATGASGSHGAQYVSIYDPPFATNPIMNRSQNGIRDVYKWLPENEFEKLYRDGTPCWTKSDRPLVPGHHWGERIVKEIDAYLYATGAISGMVRASNWTINGGMIANTMHIVSGAGSDRVNANAVCGPSRINFDYRMTLGLPILEALSPFFPSP